MISNTGKAVRGALVLLTAVGTVSFVFGQKIAKRTVEQPTEIRVAMEAGYWQVQPGQAEFVTYQNAPTLHVLPNAKAVVLNNVVFRDGTIEYDLIPEDPRFTGIYFRRQDANESEYVYLRVALLGNAAAMEGIQYAPNVKGVLLWDLFDQFQAPVPTYRKGEWNHVKLVVSGAQMLVYVNNEQRPVLEVPRLEGNTEHGGLAFEGAGYIANLTIRPNQTEGLCAREGYDPTRRNARYLRTWQVSQPQALPVGQELMPDALPNAETAWQPIAAERYGLVNLTRQYGGNKERKLVWLRTKLTSPAEQKRRLQLGFSDDIWVFLNGQPIYFDRNVYTAPALRKTPEGRIAIENGAVDLPLRAGGNELLIGVANNFYGWGLMARLDSAEGLGLTVYP